MNSRPPDGDALDQLWAALGEADVAAPPPELRHRVLAAALEGRAPGRPEATVASITPLQAYRLQVEAFDTLLASLDEPDWHRRALRDLDVQGLVGHLIGVEADFHRALDLAGVAQSGAVPARGDGVDHIASTQPFAEAQAGRAGAQTHADWLAAAQATAARLAVEPAATFAREVGVHGLELPLDSWLVVRTFELWTHDEDVRRATGRRPAPPAAPALRLMTDLAVALLPAGMARVRPGREGVARLILTGDAGGCWTVSTASAPSGPAAARIVADTVDFCRVAAARVRPERLTATITGDRDLALHLLEGAYSLALD